MTFLYYSCTALIARGLALGIALVVYGREEQADTWIEQLTRDQDPILRYGGMYALALAYKGTSNNSAIRCLLHFAVSDVSDDVRRAAVLALGFVLCGEPTQVSNLFYRNLCLAAHYCSSKVFSQILLVSRTYCRSILSRRGAKRKMCDSVFADASHCFASCRILQCTCALWCSYGYGDLMCWNC